VWDANGLNYITTADIRSAYPSLWAHWLCSIYPEHSGLRAEKEAYEKIFLDPAINLKEHLSRLTGVPVSEIKDVMISYFNGKGFRKHVFVRRSPKSPYVRFNFWLKANFPKLYEVWTKMDIRQTGNQIGKNFETKLMLDGSIFEKAASLGLAIGYENDGFSIFGKVGKDHPSVTQFLDFVTEQSIRLLGIKLVIVPKPTPTWNPSDVLRESYEEKADTLCENWVGFCKRFFRSPPANRDWSQMEKRKDGLISGLQQCAKVLERIKRQTEAL
jgi:hypothetical protein